MDEATGRGRFYTEFAHWWPLLSQPEDYAEEAGVFAHLLRDAAERPVRRVLELGCGGGNNAMHLKADFELLLTDISTQMLAVSQALNPECEHRVADMRSLRLDRRFDAVFVHDAASYLTSAADVAAMLVTARHHLEPGGVLLLAPDFIAESFRSTTTCGGHDGEGRALRYLEWMWDPDPDDGIYFADYALMLHEGDALRVERDRHVCGLFSRDVWLLAMEAEGLTPQAVVFEHSEMDTAGSELFLAVLPTQ